MSKSGQGEVFGAYGGIMRFDFKYVPDEWPKKKHHGNRSIPGFVPGRGGELVGKCPNAMSTDLCERLLNEGIAYSSGRWSKPYPQNIYNIHAGAIYRATQTQPGVSYHGFPVLPAELKQLPRALKEQLLNLAEKKNCRQKIERLLF